MSQAFCPHANGSHDRKTGVNFHTGKGVAGRALFLGCRSCATPLGNCPNLPQRRGRCPPRCTPLHPFCTLAAPPKKRSHSTILQTPCVLTLASPRYGSHAATISPQLPQFPRPRCAWELPAQLPATLPGRRGTRTRGRSARHPFFVSKRIEPGENRVSPCTGRLVHRRFSSVITPKTIKGSLVTPSPGNSGASHRQNRLLHPAMDGVPSPARPATA